MRVTLEELVSYLEQYDPETVVFLTDDDARESGYEEDNFVILEDAINDIQAQFEN